VIAPITQDSHDLINCLLDKGWTEDPGGDRDAIEWTKQLKCRKPAQQISQPYQVRADCGINPTGEGLLDGSVIGANHFDPGCRTPCPEGESRSANSMQRKGNGV